MHFTPIILIHLFAALAAVATGGIMLAMKKGTRQHRLVGRVWVALMLTTALVSFGMRQGGQFSWIHLLSILTLASIGAAVYAVMRGRIAAHQRSMVSLYIGLVIAGMFALLPNRPLGHFVWHAVGLI